MKLVLIWRSYFVIVELEVCPMKGNYLDSNIVYQAKTELEKKKKKNLHEDDRV